MNDDITDILARREADDAYAELAYFSPPLVLRQTARVFVFIREIIETTKPARCWE